MDIEAIKAANRLEEIINTDLTVIGSGRWLTTEEHDSLAIDTEGQYYFWNSQQETGDVFDWLVKRRGWDFKQAVEHLCHRARLEKPVWTREAGQQAVAKRAKEDIFTIAARQFVRSLRASEEAQAYAHGRGWTDETIKAAGLGYCDSQALRKELLLYEIDLSCPAAKAVLGIQSGGLVYPHVRGGRVRYLSARSIKGKRHYNLPEALAGSRQPFFNHVHRGAVIVICEGQADAITWGQWGIAAVALAGCNLDVALARELSRYAVCLALDADPAGASATRKAAALLGPMCQVLLSCLGGSSDANEALQAGVTQEQATEMVHNAPTWVEVEAARAGAIQGIDRTAALQGFFALVRRMDEFQISVMRKNLAKAAGIGLREFNALLKASVKEPEKPTEDDDGATIAIDMAAGHIDDHLFEMVYVPEEEKTRFAVRYPDGKIAIVDELRLPHHTIVPKSPLLSEIREGAILLADGLAEYESEKELYEEVKAFIHRYLEVDDFFENLAAYYVLFSYHYDSYRALPYLRALGEYGTGKSRFIMTIGQLCYRPIIVAGASSVSPIMRLMGAYRGTLIIDEGDFSNSDEYNVLTKILNQGAMVNFPVLRSVKLPDGNWGTEAFNVFCPKVIASRKRWDDPALESRCITYETTSTEPNWDIPRVEPHSWEREARRIRNKLLRYRLEKWQPEIDVTNEDLDRGIESRLNQVTAALKKVIGDDDLKAQLTRFIREYQRQTTADRGMTLVAKVLEALLELSEERVGVGTQGEPLYDLTIKTLAKRTNKILDEENTPEGEDDERQRPALGIKAVGNIVRKNLQLKTERDYSSVGGNRFAVVWDTERIKSLCTRYGLEHYVQQLRNQASAAVEAQLVQDQVFDQVFND